MDPRPAATVILAREGARGVEVLVLTRGEDSRFLPGFVVFPGGTIDSSDAGLAERLFGDRSEDARACALRELHEETGILLTASGPVARPSGEPLEQVEFEPLPTAELPEVARWVAPEFLETRFDARFFAAAAPPGIEPVPDGSEIADARWASPAGLLEAAGRGDLELMWPTFVTMRALAGCRRVEDVLALHVEQIPSPEAAR